MDNLEEINKINVRIDKIEKEIENEEKEEMERGILRKRI